MTDVSGDRPGTGQFRQIEAMTNSSPANNDNRSETPEAAPEPGGLGADLLMAVRFHSRLPTGNRPHEPRDIGRMAPALPLASPIIGLPGAAVLLAGALLHLPALFTACPGVAVSALVRGAMAEDAMALTAWDWRRLCVARVGGQTGDPIGGEQALLEIALLCAFIVFAGR